MTLEDIKTMLGEAYTQDVENAINALIDGAANGGTGYVPQAKYNKIKGLYDELIAKQTNLDESENALNSLKQELDNTKKSYQEYKTQSEAKLTEMKNDYAFEKALAGYKPRNIKAVSALIDKSKLSYSDSGVEGLKEQIEALQKSDAFLFEQEPVGTGMPHDATALNQSTSSLDDPKLRNYFGLDKKGEK